MITATEQGKPRIWRFYYLRSINEENLNDITHFNLGESDVNVPMKL